MNKNELQNELKILNCDDIRKLENLNEEMIKEYYRLGEERLKDCLDTKKQLEQKSFILLSGYATISIALFGFIINSTLPGIFLLIPYSFIVGIIFLLLSMRFQNYGNLGRHPISWLRGSEYLTITKENIAHIYSYNLHSLVEKISESKNSNDKKRIKITIAIYCGIVAICVASIITPFFLFLPHHQAVEAVNLFRNVRLKGLTI